MHIVTKAPEIPTLPRLLRMRVKFWSWVLHKTMYRYNDITIFRIRDLIDYKVVSDL